MSHKTVELERLATSDDKYFRGGEFYGKQFPLKFEVKIHPTSSGIIVVNYPGYNGDIDGYNNKYGAQADFIQEQNLGSVVRSGNHHWAGFEFDQSTQDDLKHIVDYSIKNAREICGSEDPSIYLMGFSAGASAIAAIAHEYTQIPKILLMAPSGDAGQEAVTEGLKKFGGEVYIAIGENDDVVGPEAGKKFYDMATGASLRELVMIPNCDHQFRGEVNGRIMSKSPFWAFGGDKTFPSPEGGMKLYD